ncbi:MAG: class I SAM-dependent methyltransferase [Verrucomicrobiota bacterium]
MRYQREIALLRSVCARGSLLDIGCGTGGFLEQLRGRYPDAYTLTGYDVAGPALEHARGLGIEVHRGSLTRLKDQGRTFDAITLWAVLEHVPNPVETVEIASCLLKPGGALLALVPNLDSLAVRLLAGKYRYILPQHVNYFSGATLRRLLSDAGGLVEVGIRGTHFNPLVIAQDFRRSGRLVPDADRARLLQRTNAYKQSALLRPMHWLYRGLEWGLARVRWTDNIVAIGRKPGK